MNPWLIAMLGYLGLAALTFVPVAAALLRRVELHDGGQGPDQSPLFTDDAKARLQQNHSRLLGTLGFWKTQAELFKRFSLLRLRMGDPIVCAGSIPRTGNHSGPLLQVVSLGGRSLLRRASVISEVAQGRTELQSLPARGIDVL